MTDVADAVPNLKQEEWPDAVPDMNQESTHAFGDLEEVADFEEESADAVSVDFKRLCNPFSIG